MGISRRTFLKGLGAMAFGGVSLAGYAFGIEPFRVRVQHHQVTPPGWPGGLRLKIAAVADVHACKPWMSAERIRSIVDQTNALEPDLIVLLGDYVTGHPWVTDWVHSRDWSEAMKPLTAPLGVHAILGNHDWWEDKSAQKRGHGPTFGRLALERVGIPVYENDVVRLQMEGRPFWLAGLGDQIALLPGRKWGRNGWAGVDDLAGTLAKVTDDAPVILLAHEPDIFPRVPSTGVAHPVGAHPWRTGPHHGLLPGRALTLRQQIRLWARRRTGSKRRGPGQTHRRVRRPRLFDHAGPFRRAARDHGHRVRCVTTALKQPVETSGRSKFLYRDQRTPGNVRAETC